MDLKKRLREFFSLKRKAGGFTLVELVVVIAILAILAGVAVPVYSGYITKANEAADNQLLNAVNKAFVSACMVHGVDNYDATGVAAPISNGVVGTVTAYGIDDFDDTFKEFYDGGTFEVFDRLAYRSSLGMFEGVILGEDVIAVDYSGGTLLISTSDKEVFNASALGGLGVTYLLGEMDNVVAYASDYPGLLANVREEDAFKSICKMFDANYDGSAAYEDLEMQALVLYTSEQYKNLDTDTLYNKIVEKPGSYIANYDTDGEDFAANAAMYALGLVYADSTEAQAIMTANGWDASNPDHIRKLMENMDGEKRGDQIKPGTEYNTFGKWLQDNEAKAKGSLAGFGGAMGMLSGNKENLDMTTILSQGYGVTGAGSLADALAGAMS